MSQREPMLAPKMRDWSPTAPQPVPHGVKLPMANEPAVLLRIAHAAETDLTEVAFNVEESFTTEEVFVRVERTVVGVKTVFKDEPNRHAVTEIFRPLDADTVARVVAGSHFKLGGVVNTSHIIVNVLITETRVDATVDLDVSSHGGAGEGAEGGDSNQRLLEHVH